MECKSVSVSRSADSGRSQLWLVWEDITNIYYVIHLHWPALETSARAVNEPP